MGGVERRADLATIRRARAARLELAARAGRGCAGRRPRRSASRCRRPRPPRPRSRSGSRSGGRSTPRPSTRARSASRIVVVLEQPGRDDLQRDRAVERELRRPVDDAHAAAPGHLLDAVAGERAARGRDLPSIVGYTARLGGRAAPSGCGCPHDGVDCQLVEAAEHGVGRAPAPRGSGGNSWFGTARTVIPAACAARMPLWESSTAAAWLASTPRRRAASRKTSGAGLPRPTCSGGHPGLEAPAQAGSPHEQLDHLRVGRGGDAERPARGHAPDRVLCAGEPRQPLPVALEQPFDDRVGDRLGRHVHRELVAHVARPLQRAHAEHVARRRVLPPAAPGGDQLAARAVPRRGS